MIMKQDIRRNSLCFFQAEDGIRDLVRSRGLGDVYKRQEQDRVKVAFDGERGGVLDNLIIRLKDEWIPEIHLCLLYTSDAADERLV